MKRVLFLSFLMAAVILTMVNISSGAWAGGKEITEEMVKEALKHEVKANELCDLGKLEKGISEYEEALSINPFSTSCLFNLGLAYLKAHRVKEAIYTYERARDLAPNDPEIRKLLGIAYVQADRKAEAIAEWEKSLSINPDQPRVKEFIEANK